jgi:hypothetical protein
VLEKIYSCDICRERHKPIELWGIRFTNNRDFQLGPAAATDGKHICERCLLQLRTLPTPADGRTRAIIG